MITDSNGAQKSWALEEKTEPTAAGYSNRKCFSTFIWTRFRWFQRRVMVTFVLFQKLDRFLSKHCRIQVHKSWCISRNVLSVPALPVTKTLCPAFAKAKTFSWSFVSGLNYREVLVWQGYVFIDVLVDIRYLPSRDCCFLVRSDMNMAIQNLLMKSEMCWWSLSTNSQKSWLLCQSKSGCWVTWLSQFTSGHRWCRWWYHDYKSRCSFILKTLKSAFQPNLVTWYDIWFI